MKHKKFIVFVFSESKPNGGLGDIFDSFETLAAAVMATAGVGVEDVAYVVDRDTWEIVDRRGDKATGPLNSKNIAPQAP